MAIQHYKGGCQCGAVRYEVNVDLDNMISCNCSRCGRLGLILAFAPEPEFTLLAGDGNLTQFNFNKHKIDHLFCKTCGVQSFAHGTAPDGARMAAINVRCIEGINPHELAPKKVDGRNF